MKLELNKISIIQILFLSFFIRLVAAYFFADQKIENEWGLLVHNLSVSGVLGINVALGDFTAIHRFAEIGEVVLPSVFMPPLYAYFIFFLKTMSQGLVNLVHLVIFVQIILSTVTIYFFYKILQKMNNFSFSTILVLIFSFFPLYVYSASQISSITLQIFLLVLFFFYLQKLLDKNNKLDILLFSVISGLSILIRGEFIFFYFLALAYFFLYVKINFKVVILSIIITMLSISPYLKRNFDNFGTLVITKSFGYNLLKGNNEEQKVEGSVDFIKKNFNQKDLNIKTDNNYEINLDNFYKIKAIEIIYENPSRYVVLYIKKFLSFLFLDFGSTYKNYYNIFNILPKIFISLVSFVGAIMSIRKKGFFQFLALYYFFNAFIFSFFFILPRYSLMILPVQLFLSIKICKFFNRKLFN